MRIRSLQLTQTFYMIRNGIFPSMFFRFQHDEIIFVLFFLQSIIEKKFKCLFFIWHNTIELSSIYKFVSDRSVKKCLADNSHHDILNMSRLFIAKRNEYYVVLGIIQMTHSTNKSEQCMQNRKICSNQWWNCCYRTRDLIAKCLW